MAQIRSIAKILPILAMLFVYNLSYSQPASAVLRIEINNAEICEFYSDILMLNLSVRNLGDDTIYLSEKLLYEPLDICVANTESHGLSGSYIYIEGGSIKIDPINQDEGYLGNIYFKNRDSCYRSLNKNRYIKMMKSTNTIEGIVNDIYIGLEPGGTYCLNAVATSSELIRRRIKSIDSVNRQQINVSIVYELKWFLSNGNIRKSLFKTEPSEKLKQQFLRYYSGEIIKAKN